MTDDEIIDDLCAAISNRADLRSPFRAFMEACRPKERPDVEREAEGVLARLPAGLTVEQVEAAIGDCHQWLCWENGDEPCQVVRVTDALDAIRALKPPPEPDPKALLRELREWGDKRFCYGQTFVVSGLAQSQASWEQVRRRIDHMLGEGGTP